MARIEVPAARVPKHVGDRLLDVQLGIGPERLEHGADGLRIQFDDAPEALTRGAPDIQVTRLCPPTSLAQDRRRMALADLDQRGGRDLSRLPLIAGGQLPEFWEHSLWLDATSGQKRRDVVNLHYHCDGFL